MLALHSFLLSYCYPLCDRFILFGKFTANITLVIKSKNIGILKQEMKIISTLLNCHKNSKNNDVLYVEMY